MTRYRHLDNPSLLTVEKESENMAMATQTLTPTRVQRPADTFPIVLKLSPVIEMTDTQFLAFCEMNDAVWIERTARGELEIMPPVGLYTGNKELDIAAQLRNWTRRNGSGVAFGSKCWLRAAQWGDPLA